MGGQDTTTNANNNVPSSPLPQQQTPQQGSSTSTQNQPQPNVNPFGNLLRGMGLGGSQGATMTFSNVNDLSQGLGGILGSLGIRLPSSPGNVQPPQIQPRVPTLQVQTPNNPFLTPPANTYRPNQQVNQPTSSFTMNPPQPTTQDQPNSTQLQTSGIVQPQVWNISNEPILRLNQTISTLNIPPEPVL